MHEKRLIVIGAGPKAMAIAAKTHVLAGLGFPVPHVHIVERRRVGAHWIGDSGYTNGLLRLGTLPEKDIGFPYQSTCWPGGREINRLINAQMMRFSWQSFLVDTGAFSDWVDRGRPAPEHRVWAEYLQWIADHVEERVTLHRGEVHRVSIEGGQWMLSYRCGDGQDRRLSGDGLVLTGPGTTSSLEGLPQSDRIMTVEGFWRDHERLRRIDAARIAIVGTGESAAAIALELSSSSGGRTRVEIISPSGMVFSRGESYRENRVFSDPDVGRWKLLSERDRRHFIDRTDRGVFSLAAQRSLDQAENIDIWPGRLWGARITGSGQVELDLEYGEARRAFTCDYVVMAMGSDHLAPLRAMSDEATLAEIVRRAEVPSLVDAEVEPLIGEHFELCGLEPRLHLPMLARVAQGPGYANLSCLGRLSDCLLSAYVAQAERRSLASAPRPVRAADPRARASGYPEPAAKAAATR